MRTSRLIEICITASVVMFAFALPAKASVENCFLGWNSESSCNNYAGCVWHNYGSGSYRCIPSGWCVLRHEDETSCNADPTCEWDTGMSQCRGTTVNGSCTRDIAQVDDGNLHPECKSYSTCAAHGQGSNPYCATDGNGHCVDMSAEATCKWASWDETSTRDEGTCFNYLQGCHWNGTICTQQGGIQCNASADPLEYGFTIVSGREGGWSGSAISNYQSNSYVSLTITDNDAYSCKPIEGGLNGLKKFCVPTIGTGETGGTTGGTVSSSTFMQYMPGLKWEFSDMTYTPSSTILSSTINYWFGSVTNTIPMCLIYNGALDIDILHDLTDGHWGEQGLVITPNILPGGKNNGFATTTFNLKKVVDQFKSNYPWVEDVKIVFWNIFGFFAYAGLCWFIWEDVTMTAYQNEAADQQDTYLN